VTFSGKDGSDARPDPEREAAEAIRIVMQQGGESSWTHGNSYEETASNGQ